MKVSIFYSNVYWTRPLNEFGLRQHVFDLYQEVFRDRERRIYPKRASGSTVLDGVYHAPAVWAAELAVLCPDYPVVAGVLASCLKRDLSFIVHTWKVPGFTDNRIGARIHDILLRRLINRASTLVVASLMQKKQLEKLGASCPVIFAPVSVDSSFWRPDPPELDECLSSYGLTRNGYVLTVGGSDRDEAYSARVARLLNLRYVRATYSSKYAQVAKDILLAERLEQDAVILVNPSRTELRSLYAGSALLCLPTKTETNPAGLSSLVEGMACGALVGVPSAIAEGYVSDGVNGLVLDLDPIKFAHRVLSIRPIRNSICDAARDFSVKKLSNEFIARNLRDKLLLVSK